MTDDQIAAQNAGNRLRVKSLHSFHYPAPSRVWEQTQPPSLEHPLGLWATREWLPKERADYEANVLAYKA